MNWKEKWERALAAIAFGEAGCRDYALDLLGQGDVVDETQSLETFLETVGLKGVRVYYGFAPV